MFTLFVVVGILGLAGYYLWPSAKTDAPAIIPLPKAKEPEVLEVQKPRWHGYDVLFELKDCLIAAGVDEKTAFAKCEELAPLLLGGQKK